MLCISVVSSLLVHFFCQEVYFKPLTSYNGEAVQIQGYYEEVLADEQDGTVRVQIRITHVNGERLLFPARATAFYMQGATEGTVFTGVFQISTTVKGSFAKYNLSKGINATLYPQGVASVTGTINKPEWIFNNIRRQAGARVRQLLGVKTGAIAAAISFGDETLLTNDLKEPFRKSGTSHLLVVSGAHLSMMAALVIYLLSRTRKNIKQKNITAIVFVLIFAAFIGFSASVVRASIMVIIFLLAPIFGRESDAITAVSFAAFLMVLVKPYIVLDMGFLLSVASVSAVLSYSSATNKIQEKYKPKSFTKLKEQLFLPVAVTLFTLPVISVFGGGVSLFSPFANLLTVLLSTPIILVTYITWVVSYIPLVNVLAIPLAFVAKLLVGVLYNIALFFSNLPFGYYYVKGVLPLLCVFSIAGIIYVGNKQQKKQKNAKRTAICLSACFLAVVVVFYSFYTKGTARIYVTATTNSVVVIKQDICVVIYNGTARQTEEITYLMQQNNISSCAFVVNMGNPNNEIVLRERFSTQEILTVGSDVDFVNEPIGGIICSIDAQKNGEIVLVQVNGYTVALYNGEVTFSGISNINLLIASNKYPFSASAGVVIAPKEEYIQNSEIPYYISNTNIRIWVRNEENIRIYEEYM